MNFWGPIVVDLRLRRLKGERGREHSQRVAQVVSRVLLSPHVREVLNAQSLDYQGECRLVLGLRRSSERYETDRDAFERFVTALWEGRNPYALPGLPFWLSVDPATAEAPVYSFPAPPLDPRHGAEPQALPPGSVLADERPPLEPGLPDIPANRIAVVGWQEDTAPPLSSVPRSVHEVLYEACVAFAGSEDAVLERPPSFCRRGGQYRATFYGYTGYGATLETAHRVLLLELRNAAARLHDEAHVSDRPVRRLTLDVIGRLLDEQVL